MSSTAQNSKSSTDQLKENLTSLPGHARGAATEAYGAIKDQATDMYGQAKDAAGEYYEQGKQKFSEYEGALEDYVRAQPIKALLIAAGVGLAIGAIWKRL